MQSEMEPFRQAESRSTYVASQPHPEEYQQPLARHQSPQYDEQFVTIVVDRLAQRLDARPAQKSTTPGVGARLTLAIVSLAVLIGGMGIIFSGSPFPDTTPSFVKLIVIFIICVSVCIVNIIFSIGNRNER